jgi:hypothetical protein
MFKSVFAAIGALTAALFLSGTPAAAGGLCDCDYGYNAHGAGAYYAPPAYYAPRAYYAPPVYYAPPPPAYYYEPRVTYYRAAPRWGYSAGYYDPPRIYGYGYVSRGPAVVVERPWDWGRRW